MEIEKRFGLSFSKIFFVRVSRFVNVESGHFFRRCFSFILTLWVLLVALFISRSHIVRRLTTLIRILILMCGRSLIRHLNRKKIPCSFRNRV